MNSIEANIRNTNTKGEVNSLRINGNVPAVIYGGTEKNQKISLSKKELNNLIEKKKFPIKYDYTKHCWKKSKRYTKRNCI